MIDPVLVFSTYLGGTKDDLGEALAIDSSGDAYITGYTLSTDFPTSSGALETGCKPSTTAACSQDAFVAKIKADGAALVYSTYVGGSGPDTGYAIAVNGSGNAYVAGQTHSTDFPTTAPYQGHCGGYVTTPSPICPADAFVTGLNRSGSVLVYSTYLGGSGTDAAYGIALDTSGNAFVAGGTISPDFPTSDPYQPPLWRLCHDSVTQLSRCGWLRDRVESLGQRIGLLHLPGRHGCGPSQCYRRRLFGQCLRDGANLLERLSHDGGRTPTKLRRSFERL